jgi:uncharacterized protein
VNGAAAQGAPNRLLGETSPYLRQHAYNPVDWYPWGDEAFEAARASGLPIFLSIGYATCHWCHVMAHESFEDTGIAAILNERYVAIKVDREERPDVDSVYMTAVQLLTGQGGWPMSVWLDAELRPFFAGTYFPAHDGDRGGSRGFASLLVELADIYKEDPQRVGAAAERITASVRAAMEGGGGGDGVPGSEALDAALGFYTGAYDAENGGVRGAPKFPSSMPVRLLLREHRRTGERHALTMAEHTLAKMAAGGMHDQLAGGFHRYSTDSRWLVPHFEKMLYDNALLATAYVEAWQVTGRRDFERVARMTLDYVLREMTAPDGGFYSATDADSEGEEGMFFVWSAEEICALLGERAERFTRYYGVTERGNFEGRNVLYVPAPDEDEWAALAGEREILRVARELRPHPLRDEKILSAWNGLMISAFAVAGFAFGERRYVDAAERAATFVLAAMRKDGRLQRSWKDGRTSGPGFLEDDAFLTAALLDLYEATFDARWLAAALEIADGTERLFADGERGGWYRTAADNETLLAREKPMHDGAEPSGASVAVLNALRLATITGDDRYRATAERALRAYAPALERGPSLHDMLLAVDYAVDTVPEIVLVWPARAAAAADAFLAPLRSMFLPNRALLGAADGDSLARLATLSPLAEGKALLDGRATAYVCTRGTCRLPSEDPAAMVGEMAALDSLATRKGADG